MNYKIIAEGGIQTKNSPLFSSSAYLLAKNSEIIGIKVNTYLTLDNNIVIADDEILRLKGINKKYINNNNYKDIQKLNIGNKVKKHYLITIDELFNLLKNSDKYIILNLIDECENNQILVDKIKKITDSYSNIYVMSSSIDIINLLLSSNLNAKIGINITENSDWNYILDFYCVTYPNILNTSEIYEKYKQGKEIMISNINSLAGFHRITKILNEIVFNTFIITKIPVQLKSHLF